MTEADAKPRADEVRRELSCLQLAYAYEHALNPASRRLPALLGDASTLRNPCH